MCSRIQASFEDNVISLLTIDIPASGVHINREEAGVFACFSKNLWSSLKLNVLEVPQLIYQKEPSFSSFQARRIFEKPNEMSKII